MIVIPWFALIAAALSVFFTVALIIGGIYLVAYVAFRARMTRIFAESVPATRTDHLSNMRRLNDELAHELAQTRKRFERTHAVLKRGLEG